MSKKVVMMIMMDGEFVAEKVVFLPYNHDDWGFQSPPKHEEADHFFY